MASLVERDLAVFWHPCSQMRDYQDFPPLEIVSAQGARLALADGTEILDAISSWWCKSLGHGHPGVRARIEAQLTRFEHVIAANTTNAPLVELCERLLALANGAPPSVWGPRAPSGSPSGPVAAGGHFGKVFLADNGSTAVEIALKMALQAQAQRGHPERTAFAALEGGYHGETVGTLSVGDLGLYAEPYRALMFPAQKLGPLPLRSGPDDPRWLDASPAWTAIEAQLASRAHTLAAIVYEPVLQAAGGMRLYSPALLSLLRRWADAHGVFLIADEIAAGMGRLGRMLASHLAAALPDFAVLSKGLTAGFLPLSAVLTTDAIYALFDGDWSERRAFLHSNTHTGNALGVAAALGALDAYAADDFLACVDAGGARMAAALGVVTAARRTLTGLRALGMVAAVDLRARDGGALDPAQRTGYRVFQEAVRRGALLRPLGDTLYLFPPLNCPHADLDRMVEILADSVDATVGATVDATLGRPFAKVDLLGQNRGMSVAPQRVAPGSPFRRLVATRYVTALREGGSVPAVVEADDGALYVVKFRAAAQGGRALAAEVVVGELGRAAGLPVPELALIEVDAALGRSEPHQEIQELLIASAGENLAMGYLAGAIGYDVAARRPVDGRLASLIVALDVFAANVDRTARNPNLLWHGGALWLIDHGAALYWHHGWDGTDPPEALAAAAARPFARAGEHVLLPLADQLAAAGAALGEALTDAAIARAVALVPQRWLDGQGGDKLPEAYVTWLGARRAALPNIIDEANRVRASRV